MLTLESYGMDIRITFKYHPSYVERIHKVPHKIFNPSDKSWSIPVSSLPMLEEEFKGELYYKTPRWKILGEPMPKLEFNLKNSYTIPSLNPGIKPFKYQEFGYQFIRNTLDSMGFAILADSVGLGKTLIGIMTFYQMYMDGECRKLLILAKKSIKRQWIAEFDKFTDIRKYTDRMEYITENANKKKRNKIYNDFKSINSGILVTTYQSCLHDEEEIKKIGFDIVIIDEAHVLRTVKGKMNTSVKNAIFDAKYKILLTGTPVMSKPKDMYALVGLCNDKYFGPFKAFEKKHVLYLNKGRYREECGYMHLDELRSKCMNITLRRTEHEVDLQLPTVIENKTLITKDATQECVFEFISKKSMSNSAMLNKILEKLRKVPQPKNVGELRLMYQKLEGMNKGLIACRQAAANDPRLLLMSKSTAINEMFKPLIPRTYLGSEKVEITKDIIKNTLDDGRKVIIFSKFERTCRLLKDDIINTMKINVLTYNGEMSEAERLEAIDLFTGDSAYNVIIGTDAMAEGRLLCPRKIS